MGANAMQQINNEYQSRINMVLEYIDENFAEQMDIDKLSKVACFSPFHFHRIFKGIVGESIISYLRRIRLERAAILLNIHKNKAILDIAIECGFSGAAVFNRCFISYFGISPSSFRNNDCLKAKHVENENKNKKYINLNEVNIRIENTKGMNVIFLKCFKGYENYIFKVFETLWEYAFQNGLVNKHTQAIGIPYDSSVITKSNQCRFDACLTIETPIQTTGEIGCKYIEGGTYLVASSVGDTQHIINIYDYLYGQWLPNSKYLPANRPMYHIMKPLNNQSVITQFDFQIYIPLE